MPKKGTTIKDPTSIRLTREAKRLLALLSERDGVSQSAWMETMIRQAARRRGVTVPEDDATE